MTDKWKVFQDSVGLSYKCWLADSRNTPVGPLSIQARQYLEEDLVHYYIQEGSNGNCLYAGTNFENAQELMSDRMIALANQEIAMKRRDIHGLEAFIKVAKEGQTNTDRDMTMWAILEMEGKLK